MSKTIAETVTITLRRREFSQGASWEGDLTVNGESEFAASGTGPRFFGVLDNLLNGAFRDGYGYEACYALGDTGE